MTELPGGEAAEPNRRERQVVGGRYRLEGDAPIGTGASGEVWRATDTLLERVVALKRVRITAQDQQTLAQLRQQTLSEGRIAARLHHPNVVSVFDVIVADDGLWLVLEYVESRSAATLLAAEGPVSPVRAAQIGTHLADALAAAHAAGIWHRDVKPGNVLIDREGRAKLTDFGISRTVNDLGLTGGGMIVGTPSYMAPETARGEPFTGASDVYGLGATLYALVEGAPPFGPGDAGNPMRMVHRVATGAVPAPTRAGPLTGVLTRLTDADPGRRPTPAAARELLAEVAHGSGAAPAAAPPPPSPGSYPPAASPGTFPPASPGTFPPASAGTFPPASPGTFPPASPGTHPPAGPGTYPPFPPLPGAQVGGPRRSTRPLVVTAVTVLVVAAALATTLAVLTRGQPAPTAPPAAAPPAASSAPPSSSAPGTSPSKYIRNPRRADPCGLIEPSNFAGFGTPQKYLGNGFHSCNVQIALNTGGSAKTWIYLFDYQQPYGTPEKHGDLTVYRSPGSNGYCLRLVALPGRTTITIPTFLTNSQLDPCQLSDIATDTVLRDLSSGSVPEKDTDGDPSSLRLLDACQLLTSDDLETVPGLNPNNVYPDFANWRCTWGADARAESLTPPAVVLSFERDVPLTPGEDGTPEKIGNRDTFITQTKQSDGQTKCMARVVHRHTVDGAGGPQVEVVNVGVLASVTDTQRCQMARTLATQVVPRLPAQ